MKHAIHMCLILTVMAVNFGFDIQAQCTPVTINCPNDITITADPGDCSEIVHYQISTEGTCAIVSLTQIDGSGLTSGDEFPIGTTPQVYRSVDDQGNMDTCTFQILINEYSNPITHEACNDDINVTANASCEVLITPDMILEGGPYGCYENYVVTLSTLNGSPVPNPITAPFVGQTIEAMVTDPNGNSCWGYVHYLDLSIPALQCGTYDVECSINEDFQPSSDPSDPIPFPVPSTFVVTPSTGTGPFMVIGYDNCGDITLTYSDQIVEIDCTLGGPYTRIIYRTWTAVDGHGNTTSCVDTIQVHVSTLSPTMTFPDRDGTDAPALLCSDDWDLNNDGIPQPEEIGDIINMNCDIWGDYTDYIQYLNCGVLINRQWQIVNMCTGQEINFTQRIRLIDDEAPEIQCEPELFGSTSYTNCVANYHVSPPVIFDRCSHVTYSVSSPVGHVVNLGTTEYPHFVINDLLEGTYTITFTATDGCGNQASCTSQLTIRDEVDPLINCESNYTLFFGSGQDVLDVDDLIIYLNDGCGIADVKLRRIFQGNCEGSSWDDTQWHDVEQFCCGDVGETILIEVGVWDLAGNFSSCISHVFVESNIASSLKCPPDITISCSYDYDPNDLSVFGEVVTDPEDVDFVMVDDQDWVENCKGQTYNGPTKWGEDGLAVSPCPITVDQVVGFETECGKSRFENGQFSPAIIREFFVRNEAGEIINSCKQRIYILDCSPQQVQIEWPDDVVIDACIGGSTHPDDTGTPDVEGSSCAEFTLSFEDMDIDAEPDTCRLINRHWAVTNTCAGGMDSIAGEYDQLIAIISSDSLSITGCIDTITLDSSVGCFVSPDNGCAIRIDVPQPTAIDCDSNATVQWEIDFDATDIFVADTSGSGPFSEFVQIGNHRIRWYANDACGGEVECFSTLIVPDCAPPISVCDDLMVFYLTDSSGVTIAATDLGDESMDNCGDVEVRFLECVTDTSTVEGEIFLYGIASDTLVAISLLNGSIQAKYKLDLIDDIPIQSISYSPDDDLIFALRLGDNPGVDPPSLLTIDLQGKILSDIQLNAPSGEILGATDAIEYQRSTKTLYMSANTNNSGAFVCNKLLTVDPNNGNTQVVTEITGAQAQNDMDRLASNGNTLYFWDFDSGFDDYFYSIDLDQITTPTTNANFLFNLGDDRPLSDLAFRNDTLYVQENGNLVGFSVINGGEKIIGQTHDNSAFNGDRIGPLTFGPALSNVDTCLFTNEILINCNDLTSSSDTFNYTIVVTDENGLADTCDGLFIVQDTSELCQEMACELIYGITSGGAFYSINTSTGEFKLIEDVNIPTNTNAVAINDDLGIGYFGSEKTVYWIDLETGEFDIVGDINVVGSLSAAAASYWKGHLYLGPESAGDVIEDIFRIKLTPDGKSFDGALENLSMNSPPEGNFGDFIVLEGDVGREKMIMSILVESPRRNNIWEYDVALNTFTLLYSIPSASSSQITIDNLGQIWYFDNATSQLGMLNLDNGEIINQNMVPVVIADLGRAWCPTGRFSSSQDVEVSENTHYIRPNPFTTEFDLVFTTEYSGETQVSIFNIDGKLIHDIIIDSHTGENIYHANLPMSPGSYIYTITNTEGTMSGKMIKL